MRQEIRNLQRKLGISMVYVTHDQAEAMSMADRVVLLRDGRIEQNAPPEVIYQRPASTFVARFIGTPPMNIIRLGEQGGGAAIEGLDYSSLPDGAAQDLSLGIRPGGYRESAMGPGLLRPSAIWTTLGADTIVDCRIGDQTVSVRAHGRIKIQPGSQVNLVWSVENVHFFESTSGQRRDDLRSTGAS